MSKKLMIQFCLLILIMFVTFFGFQITSSMTTPINQLDLYTEKDIDSLLLEKEKLIKGKTAYAVELCKFHIKDSNKDKVISYQIEASSPTSVIMSVNNEKQEAKFHCAISYDTTTVEFFHKI